MRPQISSLLVILAAAMVAAVVARGGVIGGGWSPIENLNAPEVKDIANFAVSEYNKQSHTSLALKNVVKGESQVVAGINYRLILAVSNGPAPEYEAVVWEKAWEHFRNLTSFKPASS